MSEKAERVVERTLQMYTEITDPVEFARQLREMVEAEFPVAKPAFEQGEEMPMHEFLARYQSRICHGVVPDFYQRQVEILSVSDEVDALIGRPGIVVRIGERNNEKSAT